MSEFINFAIQKYLAKFNKMPTLSYVGYDLFFGGKTQNDEYR